MSAALCANRFTLDSVFLILEREGNIVCCCKDGNGVNSYIEDMIAAAEGDVTETEGG